MPGSEGENERKGMKDLEEFFATIGAMAIIVFVAALLIFGGLRLYQWDRWLQKAAMHVSVGTNIEHLTMLCPTPRPSPTYLFNWN